MEDELTPDNLAVAEPVQTDKQPQVVPESTPVDKQPGQTTDEGTTVTPQPVTEAKPYTYEELEAEKDFTRLDPKRLPEWYAKQVNAYKSLQGEFTKTKEELNAARKQTPGQEQPPKDAFEAVSRAFEKNDQTTISNIFGHLKGMLHQKKMEIYQAKQQDPLDPKIGALEQELYQYEVLGDQLQGTITNLSQQREMINSLVSTTEAELFKAIPNFKERAPELMDFAVKELKLEPRMVYAITDPVAWTAVFMQGGSNPTEAFRLGRDTVVKVQNAINEIQLRLSGKGLQDKADKTPPKVEGAGGNYSETKSPNLDALFNKAKKSGSIDDWARYQDAQRAEQTKKINRR